MRTVLYLGLAGLLLGCGDSGTQPDQSDMDYSANAQRWIGLLPPPNRIAECQ